MKDEQRNQENLKIVFFCQLTAYKELAEEIDYQMHSVDDDREGSDGPYDEVDALEDTMTRAESNGDAPKLLLQCRKVAIQLGWYREVSEEELSRTISTGKKYDFKLDNRKYVWKGR